MPRSVIFAAVLLSSVAAFGQDPDHYTKVANGLVELINAGDYAGIQTNFNRQMDAALPLEKSGAFFSGLTQRMGKLEKLGEPRAVAGAMVYPAKFEKGALDMQLALEGRRDLIAGLLFKPHAAASKQQPDPEAYIKIARRLVELVNTADYSGVESLFSKDMSKALPLDKATEFFTGLTAQAGKIQKLDEPKRYASGTVFPARFERGVMDMSLALDGENKIAGLVFQL